MVLLLVLLVLVLLVLVLLLQQQNHNQLACSMIVQTSVTSLHLNRGCFLAGWCLAGHPPGAFAAAVRLCTVYDTGRMRAAVQAAKLLRLYSS
jgi:hypothetical protein